MSSRIEYKQHQIQTLRGTVACWTRRKLFIEPMGGERFFRVSRHASCAHSPLMQHVLLVCALFSLLQRIFIYIPSNKQHSNWWCISFPHDCKGDRYELSYLFILNTRLSCRSAVSSFYEPHSSEQGTATLGQTTYCWLHKKISTWKVVQSLHFLFSIRRSCFCENLLFGK